MCLELKIKKLRDLKAKESNEAIKKSIQSKIDALNKHQIVTK